MPFPVLAAMAVVSVASSIYSGYSSSRTSKKNARMSALYGRFNHDAILGASRNDAGGILAVGRVNSQLAMAGAQANALGIAATTNFNVQRILATTQWNYNAKMNEIQFLSEEIDLAVDGVWHEFARNRGAITAGYAANNIQLGDMNTSPTAVAIDNRRNYELDVAIIERGGLIKTKKMLDAAAISLFDGYSAAQKVQFEGKIATASTLINGSLQSAGIQAQAGINAAMTRYNGGIQAWQALQGGNNSASQYSSLATQQMTSGIMNGIASGTSLYASGGGFAAKAPNTT